MPKSDFLKIKVLPTEFDGIEFKVNYKDGEIIKSFITRVSRHKAGFTWL